MARGTYSTANYFTHTGATATSGQKVAFSAWIKIPVGTNTQAICGVRNGDSGAGNWVEMRIEDTGGASKAQFVYEADNGADVTAITLTTTNTWAIGRRSDFAQSPCDGLIADVGIWIGRTFTEGEIADLAVGNHPSTYPTG